MRLAVRYQHLFQHLLGPAANDAFALVILDLIQMRHIALDYVRSHDGGGADEIFVYLFFFEIRPVIQRRS